MMKDRKRKRRMESKGIQIHRDTDRETENYALMNVLPVADMETGRIEITRKRQNSRDQIGMQGKKDWKKKRQAEKQRERERERAGPALGRFHRLLQIGPRGFQGPADFFFF